jgi:uncharacterized protein (DUF1697 family)
MSVQVALLRAINVAGTGKLPMAGLRAVATSIGFKHVRSLLQSGSLIFDADSKTPTASEKLLEIACARTFGLTTEIYVRVPAELEQIIARNPFAKEATDDPGHLVVLFMRTAPAAKSIIALRASIAGRERVRGNGRYAYITFPDGIGRSRLTGAKIERYLGRSGTGRNWNTALKLAAATKAEH